MSFSLRDYQQEAVEAVEREWQRVDSTLLVMATGLGKTEIFTELCRRHHEQLGWRSLIICPQLTLIDQAADKIRRRTEHWPDIEQAERYALAAEWIRSPYVVASKQTLISRQRSGAFRYERLRDISHVIVDEAHLSVTKQYEEILGHYRQQGAQILGVTATPMRADKRGMGQLYQSCAYQYDIHAATEAGWLVPAVSKTAVLTNLKLSDLKTGKGGDFSELALSERMEDVKVVAEIALITARETRDKKTAIFCASVEEARRVAERLTDHYGIRAAWICSDPKWCPKSRRGEILASFHAGGITHLANVGILTTGWDCPDLAAIVQARPTNSLSLYTQIFGRGTRPLPGVVDGPETPEARRAAIADSAKPDWLIIDLVDSSLEHKLITFRDVLAGRAGLGGAASGADELPGEDDQDGKKKSDDERPEATPAEWDETRRIFSQIKAEGEYQLQTVDPFAEPEGKTLKRRSTARWTFGRYKGHPLSEIPTDYLERMAPTIRTGWLKGATYGELRRRKNEHQGQPGLTDLDSINDLFLDAMR